MEESVELRAFIDNVLKGKWIIAIVTLICVLFATVFSWFVLPEKFESKAVVQVISGVQDAGILENYVASEFSPQVYSQRVKNEAILSNAFKTNNLDNSFNIMQLNVANESNTNLVNLTYMSNSPENAQKELQIILDTTKNEMNTAVQKTLKDLEITYNTEANSLLNQIETIINKYNKIIRDNNLPEVLILQTILNSEVIITISDEQTKGLSTVSGNLQNQLLQLQSQIQIKSNEYRKVLAEYQSVKIGLESFKPDPFIRVITEPTLENVPVSPNKVLNIAIAIIFGLLLGVGLLFFRNFWQNTTPAK